MGIYLQVYNLKPDEKTHKSDAAFVYTVKRGDQQVMQFKEYYGHEADRRPGDHRAAFTSGYVGTREVYSRNQRDR